MREEELSCNYFKNQPVVKTDHIGPNNNCLMSLVLTMSLVVDDVFMNFPYVAFIDTSRTLLTL